jgi:hypothetical protein
MPKLWPPPKGNRLTLCWVYIYSNKDPCNYLHVFNFTCNSWNLHQYDLNYVVVNLVYFMLFLPDIVTKYKKSVKEFCIKIKDKIRFQHWGIMIWITSIH